VTIGARRGDETMILQNGRQNKFVKRLEVERGGNCSGEKTRIKYGKKEFDKKKQNSKKEKLGQQS